MQIASRFCEHALGAVNDRRSMEVFLQRDRWGWYTLCPSCIALQESRLDTDFLACEKCVAEWATATGSDYLARCQSPIEEWPDGERGSPEE